MAKNDVTINGKAEITRLRKQSRALEGATKAQEKSLEALQAQQAEVDAQIETLDAQLSGEPVKAAKGAKAKADDKPAKGKGKAAKADEKPAKGKGKKAKDEDDEEEVETGERLAGVAREHPDLRREHHAAGGRHPGSQAQVI